MQRAAAALALAVCACSGSGGGSGGEQNKTPEVGFRVMHPTSVPIVAELPGRVIALRTAEVRPQISGVIQRRLFTEGALVRKGEPLYQIDPSVYRAEAAQAKANLASAQANAQATKAKAERYRPLAAEQAVAQQDYTDAAAAARQASASVAQNRAALNSARINLRYTRVPAPITGRIGRSLVTEGALVTSDQANPLAVISVLDPIYVDIQQSSSELLHFRRELARGGVAPVSAPVRLKFDDGSDYGYAGTVEFSEVTSDPSTGTVTMRSRFPNPEGLLLPGMFVRARFAQASEPNAFLVPQVALTRDPTGKAQVLVVGKDNKAVARTVTAQRTQGDAWVVTAGLANGDRVVTQGLGKVKPVPETTPQRIGGSSGQETSAGGKTS
jgi:membrane fusion protein (multidrug efflux system)